MNALNSRGPVTPEGKAIVSRNRRAHGLYGKFRVLSCESQEDFDALVAGLTEAEQPANASEIELVVKMAKHTWLSHRALRLQADAFEQEQVDKNEAAEGINRLRLDGHRLQVAMRYHTMHDRAYQRATNELIERRKQRRLAEIGFERKRAAEAEAQRKAERHELTQEILKLKTQLLEIRVANRCTSELNRIKPSYPPREQEFRVTEYAASLGLLTTDD